MANNFNFWEEEIERCKDQHDTQGFIEALNMLAFLERECTLASK